jgi:hypothetical protein
MTIIGISGKPEVGKDHMAKMLAGHGYVRESLADRIRELTMQVTGLTMRQLREHPYKDEPVPEFNNKTPRELTIEMGASVETVFGPEIWNIMTDNVINEEGYDKVVIPDLRTPVQADWIKKQGGFLVRIECNSGPHKYDIENQLDKDNYPVKNWDFIVEKSMWFRDPVRTIQSIIYLLE